MWSTHKISLASTSLRVKASLREWAWVEGQTYGDVLFILGAMIHQDVYGAYDVFRAAIVTASPPLHEAL